MLDHVVVLDERHLCRLVSEYIEYYHQDRPHLGLRKDAPYHRPVEELAQVSSQVVAIPRLGGLQHRYTWSEAA